MCSGTWCPKTKKQGLAGGEPPRPPGHGRKNAGDLVQRERMNKGRRDFVHQDGAGHGRRNAGDLVQRERMNKGRRDFVHQVGAGHGRKNAGDLVQRKRRYKGRRDFVHQVAPPAHTEVYKHPYDNKSVLKGNFFCGIILSPERNQRCNTGNNMKGDAI